MEWTLISGKDTKSHAAARDLKTYYMYDMMRYEQENEQPTC